MHPKLSGSNPFSNKENDDELSGLLFKQYINDYLKEIRINDYIKFDNDFYILTTFGINEFEKYCFDIESRIIIPIVALVLSFIAIVVSILSIVFVWIK